jgi:hypothetical protein
MSSSSVLSSRPLPSVRETRPGRGRPVRLDRAWFYVYPFETRRCGEATSCPPRTVGWAGMAMTGDAGGSTGDERLAVEICVHGSAAPPSPEAAKEKVTLGNARGDTAVFQADRATGSAALCACGNATAAAAATLALHRGRRQVRQRLQLPDGPIDVVSDVTGTHKGSWRVRQSWADIRVTVRQATLLGRRLAVCTGSFNNYLIVPLPDLAALGAFVVEDALALWDEARDSCGFDQILRSRLVALAPSGAEPQAKFFTCGRMHPGAPLTGLATLSMAARHVDWLAALLQGGRLGQRRGVDPLPAVRGDSQDLAIEFAAIDVVLHGM